MAAENGISSVRISWPAGADLSTAGQYRAVQLTTVSSQEVITLADATVRTIGILQDTPASGVAGSVCVSGWSRAETDGSGTAIVAMDALAPNASGILVKTTADNDEMVAVALEPSTVAGKIISVLVMPGRRY